MTGFPNRERDCWHGTGCIVIPGTTVNSDLNINSNIHLFIVFSLNVLVFGENLGLGLCFEGMLRRSNFKIPENGRRGGINKA